jgi:hypothetical protein
VNDRDPRPATLADLDRFAERIVEATAAAIRAAAEETRSAIQTAEERSAQQARDIETNLLRAYHGSGSGIQTEQRRLDANDRAILDRLSALEERVLNLQTRRPPQ